MNVNGDYRIPASRDRVGEALHDPEILRACIPGCEELHRLSPTEYEGRLTAQIGAVTNVFTGRLMMDEGRHPYHWTLTAELRSSQAGWAEGLASVELEPDGIATVLIYRARIDPGGRLASVSGPLLHGAAIRMADEFLACLMEHLRPHPLAAEPQEMAGRSATMPRRLVTPLAPTSAPDPRRPIKPPFAKQPLAEPPPMPRDPRRVILIGLGLWLAIALCLFWPL